MRNIRRGVVRFRVELRDGEKSRNGRVLGQEPVLHIPMDSAKRILSYKGMHSHYHSSLHVSIGDGIHQNAEYQLFDSGTCRWEHQRLEVN